MNGPSDENIAGGNGLDRRLFLMASGVTMAATLAPSVAQAAGSDELTWMPAWRIRDGIVAGKFSALQVTRHFLERIARLDPVLHAFRDVAVESALAEAASLDKSLKDGAVPGPLFGVPVAIKEHIEVKGLTSVIAHGHGLQQSGDVIVGREDAICVERLRKAGAVIIGTTVMPGMGIGVGMSDLARHPRNPWDPERVPGSSSAGSAAALASAMVPLAIGGDGGGSTRLPAALNGVLGIHPTTGRVPDVVYSNNYFRLLTGSFGPMARSARDIAIAMKAIAGPDGRDMMSTLHGAAPDYLKPFAEPVRNEKVGWTPDFGFASQFFSEESPELVDIAHQAALRMRDIGATVTPSDIKAESFWPHVATTMYFYDGQKQDDAAVRASLQARMRNRARFDAELEKFDFLVSPAAVFTAPTVEQWNASWKDLAFAPRYTATTFMFNWIMLPAMSIPIGFHNGLPVGLQIVGKPDSEPRMLALAEAYLAKFPQTAKPRIN